MGGLITFSAFFILLLNAICVYRLVKGPTVFDRAIGVSLISNNAVILIVIIGFIFGRVDMFFDIALAYALLNFILAIVLGKYFERRGKRA